MNITDVGHLTSDADTGEDKIEVAVRREKKSAWDIAKFYTKTFKTDLKHLNVLSPNVWCKATDHINEQLAWIYKLERAGFTYQTSDGIYFNTSKLKDYGKLARLDKQQLKAGARVAVGAKKNKKDFALWKFSPKGKKRQMEWKSKYGVGFPGWHIECSVMASKYLGTQFDIHCGGIDHIPVHHTNEIAQTEAIIKKKWVNYWLHNEFLILEKGKMAKSGKSFITLNEVEDREFSALDLRYLYLNSHYRKQLHFSWKSLNAAKNARERLVDKIKELKETSTSKNKKEAHKYKKIFFAAINDDLNTPEVLGLLWIVIRDTSLGTKEKLDLLKEMDKVLGLALVQVKKDRIPEIVLRLVAQRERYRKKKEWQKADKARELIRKKGYIVEDVGKGFRIKKA